MSVGQARLLLTQSIGHPAFLPIKLESILLNGNSRSTVTFILSSSSRLLLFMFQIAFCNIIAEFNKLRFIVLFADLLCSHNVFTSSCLFRSFDIYAFTIINLSNLYSITMSSTSFAVCSERCPWTVEVSRYCLSVAVLYRMIRSLVLIFRLSVRVVVSIILRSVVFLLP